MYEIYKYGEEVEIIGIPKGYISETFKIIGAKGRVSTTSDEISSDKVYITINHLEQLIDKDCIKRVIKLEVGKYYEIKCIYGTTWYLYITKVNGDNQVAHYILRNEYNEDGNFTNNGIKSFKELIGEKLLHLQQCITARKFVEYKAPIKQKWNKDNIIGLTFNTKNNSTEFWFKITDIDGNYVNLLLKDGTKFNNTLENALYYLNSDEPWWIPIENK